MVNHHSNRYWLADEAATQRLGQALAKVVEAPAHIYLQGDIGTGKTTLARAMLREFGVSGAIKSPTFAIIEPYALTQFALYHFDLYRLTDPEELEYISWRDYFTEHAICCVEWPERAATILPRPDLLLVLTIQAGGRQVECSAATTRGRDMLHKLAVIMGAECGSLF